MPAASVTFQDKRLDFLACVSEQGYPLSKRTAEIEELTTPGVDGSNFRRVRYADAIWEFVGYTDCSTFANAVIQAGIAEDIDGNACAFTGTFGDAVVSIPAANMKLIAVSPRPGKATGGGASGAAHLFTSWRMTILGAYL